MAEFTRRPASNGRVHFEIPVLESHDEDELIEEFGLIAASAGIKIHNTEPARLHSVAAVLNDGSHSSRVGSMSVPSEIADDVEAGLKSHGHVVRSAGA